MAKKKNKGRGKGKGEGQAGGMASPSRADADANEEEETVLSPSFSDDTGRGDSQCCSPDGGADAVNQDEAQDDVGSNSATAQEGTPTSTNLEARVSGGGGGPGISSSQGAPPDDDLQAGKQEGENIPGAGEENEEEDEEPLEALRATEANGEVEEAQEVPGSKVEVIQEHSQEVQTQGNEEEKEEEETAQEKVVEEEEEKEAAQEKVEEGEAPPPPNRPNMVDRSYSGLDEDFLSEMQARAPGFRPSFGGEELRRAFAALGGTALLTPHTPQEETLGQAPAEEQGGRAKAGGAAAGGGTGGGGAPEQQKQQQQQKQAPAAKVPLPPLPVREVEDARSRELMFAAKRYCAAFISNPNDFHAAYNHGLVLQELAGIRGRRPADQEKLLLEASESYGAALQICRGAHAVLYNWGVALTDLARLAKMSGSPEHRNYLSAAGEKYAAALRWNPRNPQALNNLGLVLQDLAQGLAPERHREVMGWAAAKFRRALRQRPDFHRAAYNLGTVYYANAAALGHHQWPSAREGPAQAMDPLVQSLFQRAAQYVCLAFALEPFKEVYRRSLAVVRAQLPLPFLRSGYLLAVRPDSAGKAKEAWVRNWFVLNEAFLTEVEAPKIEEHHALKQDALLRSLSSSAGAAAAASDDGPQQQQQNPGPLASRNSSAASLSRKGTAGSLLIDEEAQEEEHMTVRIQLQDVSRVQRSYDPSLPGGGGIWLQLRGDADAGLYLLADTDEEADCWVDALLLGAFLVEQRREEALARALRSNSVWEDADLSPDEVAAGGIAAL